MVRLVLILLDICLIVFLLLIFAPFVPSTFSVSSIILFTISSTCSESMASAPSSLAWPFRLLSVGCALTHLLLPVDFRIPRPSLHERWEYHSQYIHMRLGVPSYFPEELEILRAHHLLQVLFMILLNHMTIFLQLCYLINARYFLISFGLSIACS